MHTLLTGIELGHQNSDNLRNTGFFGSAATSIIVPTSIPYAIADELPAEHHGYQQSCVRRHRRPLRAGSDHPVETVEADSRFALRLLQGGSRRPADLGAGHEPGAHRHRLQSSRRFDLGAR